MADELASKIRQARVGASLSREQVAVALGITLSTVVRWETGRTKRIAIESVAALAELTGYPLGFFLNGAADKPATSSQGGKA